MSWIRIAQPISSGARVLYPIYSEKLLFLGFPWALTAPLFMVLVAIMFAAKVGSRYSSLGETT
jgi:hypothetical protein